MPNPQGSFIWYELMTPDANAAARFYGDVVGWTIAARPDPNAPAGRDYRMIGRSDGGSAGGVLALSPAMTAGGARPAWVGYHFVPDVDAAVRAIEADGGRVLMRMTIPVGDIAMVTDPMGAPLYVMRPVPPPGKAEATSDVFHASAAQHIRWNELQSPDVARAKSFYGKHFGFRFPSAMSMGPLGEYSFIDHDAGALGGVMPLAPEGGTPGWRFYFGVPSVTAAERAIVAGGGRIERGMHQVPGGEWVVMARDPQGAPFGVVGVKGE
ncbi:MAG: VOC family protein [Sandaracinaceae bacterium]|nr:VOC family protein [Sandaracinaceae bacterium]